MKKLLLGIFLVSLVSAGLSQSPAVVPMAQSEYVRMLYEVEQAPSKLIDLVEMVRVRGIDFKMTSGLRTLTKSKAKGDAELLRTIEEANRRRENPVAAKRPGAAEIAALIENTRKNTLAAVDEMPDFVVKQRIRRSIAYAGTNNFQGLDRLIVSVSYRADGREEYRLLSQNGVDKTDSRTRSSYSEVGGTSSTGEFVTVLATIFKTESKANFDFLDTDLLRGKNALIFEFSVDRDRAQQQITSYGYIADSTISGMSGKIWIDREDARVLRIDSYATQIPAEFPVTAAKRMIDYDWVDINGLPYLLPSSSDVRLTAREGKRSFESRNFIEFKDYQKFGSEVLILDDDAEFVDDPSPIPEPQNPLGPPPIKKPVKPEN